MYSAVVNDGVGDFHIFTMLVILLHFVWWKSARPPILVLHGLFILFHFSNLRPRPRPLPYKPRGTNRCSSSICVVLMSQQNFGRRFSSSKFIVATPTMMINGSPVINSPTINHPTPCVFALLSVTPYQTI